MQLFYSALLSMPLSLCVSLGASACLALNAGASGEAEQVIQLAAVPVRLSASEIQVGMATLPKWRLVGASLVYERRFSDFVEAIAFVNRLVEPAEQLGHHPDITINYNHIMLKLTTHDAGGLTELDFALANRISMLEPGRREEPEGTRIKLNR